MSRLLFAVPVCLAASLCGVAAAPAQETTNVTAAAAKASAAARAPVSPEVQAGLDHVRRGDPEAAVALLSQLVKRSKNDADAWRVLGLAYVESSRPKDAVKAYRRALKLSPTPAARAGLAYSLLLANKRGEARSEIRRIFAQEADAETHYFFARLLLASGQTGDAVRHSEAAVKLDPAFASAHLLRSLALVRWRGPHADEPPPDPADKETIKARQRALGERMGAAAASLEAYLRLNPTARDAALWREQLESLRHYAQAAQVGRTAEGRTLFAGVEVTKKAVITFKPEPTYTEEARQRRVTGLVRLRLTLDADGTVKHVLVLESLPYGLTESSVRAARRIRFTPAVLDGRPVATPVVIEYNFNIY